MHAIFKEVFLNELYRETGTERAAGLTSTSCPCHTAVGLLWFRNVIFGRFFFFFGIVIGYQQ